MKVGNSNPAMHSSTKNWQDGHPIVVMGPGLRIAPNDWTAWVQTRVRPPGFDALGACKQAAFIRRVRAHRAILKPGLDDGQKLALMLNLRGYYDPGQWEKFASKAMAERNAKVVGGRTDWAVADFEAELVVEFGTDYLSAEQADFDSAVAVGVDTNWGRKDLMVHYVVVADLTLDQAEEMVREPTDLSRDATEKRRQRWAARAYKIPYDTLLSAQSVVDVRNSAQHMPVARGEKPFMASMVMKMQQAAADSDPNPNL